MKKADKKIFLYALVMSGAVLLIILISFLSEMKVNDLEQNYNEIILKHSEEAKNYSDRLQILQEENNSLKKELNKLKNKESEIISSGETYNQATKILSDIFFLIESGEKDKAKAELEKFDTSTFDDTIINYKKALEKLIE